MVVRCVPEGEVAYHASDANSYSIGVEVCHPDWNGKPTDKAYKVLVELLVELCRKYKLDRIQAIIRHYDVTGKACPKYYVENVSAFKKLKEKVKGIISSPDVWIKGNYTKDNVRSLVIKVSSYVDKI